MHQWCPLYTDRALSIVSDWLKWRIKAFCFMTLQTVYLHYKDYIKSSKSSWKFSLKTKWKQYFLKTRASTFRAKSTGKSHLEMFHTKPVWKKFCKIHFTAVLGMHKFWASFHGLMEKSPFLAQLCLTKSVVDSSVIKNYSFG